MILQSTQDVYLNILHKTTRPNVCSRIPLQFNSLCPRSASENHSDKTPLLNGEQKGTSGQRRLTLTFSRNVCSFISDIYQNRPLWTQYCHQGLTATSSGHAAHTHLILLILPSLIIDMSSVDLNGHTETSLVVDEMYDWMTDMVKEQLYIYINSMFVSLLKKKKKHSGEVDYDNRPSREWLDRSGRRS